MYDEISSQDSDQVTAAKLLGSFLLFIRTFYKLRTGREFVLSSPSGRESHYITICRELTAVFNLKTRRLMINIPPGHGKSEILIHFVAWCLAHYPDCQFLYISYSHELAAKHTFKIKQIISLIEYQQLFGVSLRNDGNAKDLFYTKQGGCVAAFGSGGAITGNDAGLPNLERFSGAGIIDDIHKPGEVHSDPIREGVLRNFLETISQRPRGHNVPIIGLAQCLHEGDWPAMIQKGYDGMEWKILKLPAIDGANNVLAPNIISYEDLMIKKDKSPYVYWSQYQQDPAPAGGGIFNVERLVILDEEPEMLGTFIDADTAETDKTYNDATAFGFFGIYWIMDGDRNTEKLGLHWIDSLEEWIKPDELEGEFMSFYSRCCNYKTPPQIAAIEKKSTGVTLSAVLKKVRGLQIIEVVPTIKSGSKIERHLAMQPIVNGQLISLRDDRHHIKRVKDHMTKITANGSHLRDDICDTAQIACDQVFLNGTIARMLMPTQKKSSTINNLAEHFNKQQRARSIAYEYGRSSRQTLSFGSSPFAGTQKKGQ
jgi:hypothetical protein